jgi:hypothetical protein
MLVASLAARSAAAGDASHDARLDELCQLLKSDPSFKVRATAARQLGTVKGLSQEDERRTLRALKDALKDDADIVRGFAAHAIGQRGGRELIGELTTLAQSDQNEFVRTAASNAIDAIKRAPKRALIAGLSGADSGRKKTQKVELGQVRLADSINAGLLLDAIKDTIEDLIEPHRPAMWPREDPDVRMDITIVRIDDSAKANRISYEARVTIVQLPGANLRHASNAKATVRMVPRAPNKKRELEKDLALKATTRAVSEALALLDK